LWILVIAAAELIIFSGIFDFRGAGSIVWSILRLPGEIWNHFIEELNIFYNLFSA